MGRIAKAFLIFIVVVPIIAFAVFAYIVINAFNSPDKTSSAQAAIANPAPRQCESGWTQRNATVYFLSPEGCESTKLVLSSMDQKLHLGLINDGSKNCESYDVSGTAYASVKLIAADVNGTLLQLTRSCVNGDEMFTPNTDADSAKLFMRVNEDKMVTIQLGPHDVLRYNNTNYLEAADNLIRFTGLNP